MFKKYIWIPVFVFVFGTVLQLIFNNEIGWVHNILFSILFYLIYVFWEWSKKPYDWNENKSTLQDNSLCSFNGRTYGVKIRLGNLSVLNVSHMRSMRRILDEKKKSRHFTL
ncbi:hypothetical protein [Lentibacillus salicampi]|uniref:Uncharacterized protein n=1 Tax=Lentibacillus salicampi TaxID=175306 RepID=A0A4Y9ACU1_9BACI|nr:hypothetical protein [Lentibacillus salicampi]TFJ93132.1 hypothetical protein E4U82_08670 [Lentibacillus salicampi]